jgi:rare lipoprotein A (peptidoglycan hydrolase)
MHKLLFSPTKNRVQMKIVYIFQFWVILLLSGCAGFPRFASDVNKSEKEETPIKQGKTVSDYDADEVSKFVSSKADETVLKLVEGVSSYYADKFHGKNTANGDIYDKYELTAAHTSYPYGTIIRVTNLKNNKQVVVKINDRKPTGNGRVLDLSNKAAKHIDMIRDGIAKVLIEVLEWGDDKKPNKE